MKIRWKKVLYFVMFLGSFVGFKNAVGQNDNILTESEKIQAYKISGQLINAKTDLPFCNVILLNSNNDTLQIVLSDFDGCFRFEMVPKGFYQIKILQIGCFCEQTTIFEVFEDFEIKIDCLKEIFIQMVATPMCYASVSPQYYIFDDYQFRTYRDYNIDGKNWNKRPRKLK